MLGVLASNSHRGSRMVHAPFVELVVSLYPSVIHGLVNRRIRQRHRVEVTFMVDEVERVCIGGLGSMLAAFRTTAGLLNDVSQFVREQSLSCRRTRGVPSRAKRHIVTDRECTRVDRVRSISRG